MCKLSEVRFMFHLWATHVKRRSHEGPSKKGEYEYLAFASHFSCEALCWLPDQMVNIAYSLFTLVRYYLIFVEVQLIYNSSNKQTGILVQTLMQNICWRLFINALWTSPCIWFIYLHFFSLSGERKNRYQASESQGFAHKCLFSSVVHAIKMWYIAEIGHYN